MTDCDTSATLALCVLYILIFIYVVQKSEFMAPRDTIPMRSKTDGLQYHVNVKLSNSTTAVEILADINQRLLKLAKHIKVKYSIGGGDPRNLSNYAVQCPEKVIQARNFLRRYNPDAIYENSPLNSEGDSSYTINKGQVLAFCLRPKDNPNSFHDANLLMFVALHEAAHIAAHVYQHETPFWKTFKFLLEEGEESGVIKNTDFRKKPAVYCGVPVKYNPYYDAKLDTICTEEIIKEAV